MCSAAAAVCCALQRSVQKGLGHSTGAPVCVFMEDEQRGYVSHWEMEMGTMDIVNALRMEHPVAVLVREVCQAQCDEFGTHTTSLLTLLGLLAARWGLLRGVTHTEWSGALSQAQELMEDTLSQHRLPLRAVLTAPASGLGGVGLDSPLRAQVRTVGALLNHNMDDGMELATEAMCALLRGSRCTSVLEAGEHLALIPGHLGDLRFHRVPQTTTTTMEGDGKHTHTHTHTHTYTHSCTARGVVLHPDYERSSVSGLLASAAAREEAVRVVVCVGYVDAQLATDQAMRLRVGDDAIALLSMHEHKVDAVHVRFLALLKEQRVSLVLCTRTISSVLAVLLDQAGISFLADVPTRDAYDAAGISSATAVSDIAYLTAHHVGACRVVCRGDDPAALAARLRKEQVHIFPALLVLQAGASAAHTPEPVNVFVSALDDNTFRKLTHEATSCARRLGNALRDQCVVVGGGCAELACAVRLEQANSVDVGLSGEDRKEDPGAAAARSAVFHVLAESLRAMVVVATGNFGARCEDALAMVAECEGVLRSGVRSFYSNVAKTPVGAAVRKIWDEGEESHRGALICCDDFGSKVAMLKRVTATSKRLLALHSVMSISDGSVFIAARGAPKKTL
jgi:hypothetical protein